MPACNGAFVAHVSRKRVTGILLAGGKSTRMGRDKALIDFGGAPLIAWCAAALAECAPTLIVSSSSAAHAQACERALANAWPRFTVLRGVRVETVLDGEGAQGPLAGFLAALEETSTESAVLSACDTPLAPATLYRRELALLAEFEAVAPALDSPEPLLSAWRAEPARRLARTLAADGRGPRALLEGLRARLVDGAELAAWGIDGALLASANTPEALGQLEDRAKALQEGTKRLT